MQERSAQSILSQAMQLSPDTRAEIVRALLDSIHGEIDPEVEAAWREEIRRRIDSFDCGEERAISAEEVRRRTQRKLDECRDAG